MIFDIEPLVFPPRNIARDLVLDIFSTMFLPQLDPRPSDYRKFVFCGLGEKMAK